MDGNTLECLRIDVYRSVWERKSHPGTNDGKKRDSFYQDQGAGKKEQNQNCLLTMDDGVVNWGEHTIEEEETNHALMAISSNNEVSLCSKTCIDSYNKLKTLCDEQTNQLGEQEAKILAYTLAVKKLEAQVVTFQKQQLSLNEQLTFQANEIYAKDEKLKKYRRIGMKILADYTPKPQEDIDDSLYVYGKKGPQKPEISDSDDNSTEHSTCQSNDSEGSFGNPSEHSSESESESISVPNEMSTSKSVTANEKVMSESKEVEPSCVTHVKTPRKQMKNQETHEVKGKNWNEMMGRELGEGYTFIKKKCFVCGSLSHLIKDYDHYEKKMAREAEFKKQRVFNTGNGVANHVIMWDNYMFVWNNANRVNRANHFVPRPVQLNAVRANGNTGRANINTVRANVNSVRQNVNSVRTNINTVRSKQPVPTNNTNSFSPVRPQVQFERTIRSIENFIPMDSEKEKESLKRSGETLQGAEKKKQKVLDVEDIPIPESAKFVKEEEIEVKQPVLKMSRRKSKARKGIGLHTSTEPESGEVDITSSKIVKWKILRHGGKGYCHLIRANQRDSVFVNFGAMLHNISRDDLVDLYKIVLQKTTAYGPEEDLESAFAENLRIMFDPPQSEDTVWSLPMHIPIVNWRYYDSCNVHCLNLHNTTAIYMLAERSYPLSEEVCSMMLKKKLFAQNTEVKKKLNGEEENNTWWRCFSTYTTNGVQFTKAPVGFDKKKLECYKCYNTGHFARECTLKGANDGKKKTDSVYQDQEAGKQKQNQIGLLTMDDGVVNWGDHTTEEEINHALMSISSNSEANAIYEKDEKLKKYKRIGMKAIKEKEQLQKTVDSWKNSSKNLPVPKEHDHAGCLDTRKISTSGGIQFLGDKLRQLDVKKKKQKLHCTVSAEESKWVICQGCAQVMLDCGKQLQDYGAFNYNKIDRCYCGLSVKP
ncbi:ribonuclease H-like domain-containing protein [Tanacetum coccineum]